MTGERTGRGRLTIQANLQVRVGGHQAKLIGSGSQLRLESDAPAALWSELTRSALPSGVGRLSGPRAIGRLADHLADLGLEFVVVGPHGDLARLGSNQFSRVGRFTTGSRSVQLGSARALVPVLIAIVRQSGAGVLDAFRRRRSPRP